MIQNIASYLSLFFIDVRPAKKDNQSSGNAGNSNTKQMSGLNNQFNSMNNQFSNATDSFGANKPNYVGGMNPNFGNDGTFGNNQKDLNTQNRSGNSNFDDGNQTGSSDNDQYNGKHNNNNNNGNDPFNNSAQNRGNNQFNLGNPNRGNDQFTAGHGNQNRGINNQFGNNNQMGNQNRPGGNQNRNQTNVGNNQNQNTGSGGGAMGPGSSTHRARGTRGGKNRNKNNPNNPNNANNFRDRSPINRGNRIEDKANRDWDHKQGDRLRGNNFARDSFNDGGNRYDDFKTSGTRDANASFG